MADSITNEQLAGKVVEAVTAVQDAEQTVVEEGKKLAAHMADPNAHGLDVSACIAQGIADHEGNPEAHGALKSEIQAALEAQIEGKASMEDVNTALAEGLAGKADKTDVESKADKSAVDAALLQKADVSALDEKADTVYMAAELDKKTDKSIILSATIGTIWAGTYAPYTQNITISGVMPNSVVDVAVSASATLAQVEAYQALNWTDGGQAANSITLRAWGDKNTVSIPIVAVVRG